jgi:hypothetical protein
MDEIEQKSAYSHYQASCGTMFAVRARIRRALFRINRPACTILYV